jgi:GTP-binding protein HflX
LSARSVARMRCSFTSASGAGRVRCRSAAELEELVLSAGGEVRWPFSVSAIDPIPAMFVGSGKLGRSPRRRAAHGAALVIFNHALTPIAGTQPGTCARLPRDRPHRADPRHLRPARALARGQVAGRTGAAAPHGHAPGARLDPPGTPARRAIGLRGPGETQLETDRRLLRERVRMLKARAGKGGPSASRGAVRAARRSCPRYPWSATPMPASRPCSTR